MLRTQQPNYYKYLKKLNVWKLAKREGYRLELIMTIDQCFNKCLNGLNRAIDKKK